MATINKEITYLFSSDEKLGAYQKNSNGNQFSVRLTNDIKIPSKAENCTLEVQTANVWFNTPNISAELKNNVIRIVTTEISTTAAAQDMTINIPDGLYSPVSLQGFLKLYFTNNGFPVNLIEITGDAALQKIIITFPFPDTQVDLTHPNSCSGVLGYDKRLVPLALPVIARYGDIADNIAKFNSVESYNIISNIIQDGLIINSNSSGVIANIPISSDQSPGSLILYRPARPIRLSAHTLIGKSLGYATFTLTSQDGTHVNTLTENFSCLITIRYQILSTHNTNQLTSNTHI